MNEKLVAIETRAVEKDPIEIVASIGFVALDEMTSKRKLIQFDSALL